MNEKKKNNKNLNINIIKNYINILYLFYFFSNIKKNKIIIKIINLGRTLNFLQKKN